MSKADQDPFLPDDYDVPAPPGNYLNKLDHGRTRLRILAKPIVGTMGWGRNGDKAVPVRKRIGEEFKVGEVDPDSIAHFWAMPVWNYQTNSVQVWELTKASIQKRLKALSTEPEWGSPLNYDVVITKTGADKQTRYETTPCPPAPLAPEIRKAWVDMSHGFDLNRLFAGGHPFGDQVPVPSSDPLVDALNDLDKDIPF